MSERSSKQATKEEVAQQQAALVEVRAALLAGADVSDKLRLLAQSLGVTRPELSTLHALHAVLDKIEHPGKYRRDQDAWEAHGAKERSYRSWKKHIVALTQAQLDVAVDTELPAHDEKELLDAAAAAFAERRESRLEVSIMVPGDREKQMNGVVDALGAMRVGEKVGEKTKLENVGEKTDVWKSAVDDQVDELRQKANTLYAQGRHKEAKGVYSDAIKLRPLAALFTNRAACYMKEKKWREAIDDCDRALLINPEWIRAYERKSSVLLELHLHRQALEVIVLGLVYDPKSRALLEQSGIAKQKIFLESQPTTYEVRGGGEELKHYIAQIDAQMQQRPGREPSPSEMQAASEHMDIEKRTTHQAIKLEMRGQVSEAIHLYEEGAAHGSTTAMCALSRIFVHGQGVAPDQERGAAWAQRCIDHGPCLQAVMIGAQVDSALHSAYGMLGQCYRHGWGVPFDITRASELLRVAAEAGDTTSMNNYGSLEHQHDRIDEAIKWYRKAAEASYPLGMANYGIALMHGCGCAENLEEAEQWLRRAAGMGDASASLFLAQLEIKKGADAITVAMQLEKHHELQKEHAGESTCSSKLIAFEVLSNEQDKLDYGTSLDSLNEQLLDLGVVPPSFSLVPGKGGQIDHHKHELVQILRQHRSLTEIETKAVDYLMQSPNGRCAHELGLFMRSRGQRESAIKAFKLGAKLSDGSSAFELAKLLLEAKDSKPDMPSVVKYLRQASAAGVEFASDCLESLRRKMAADECSEATKFAPSTRAAAVDDVVSLLKKETTASAAQLEHIRAAFGHMATSTSPSPESTRLLGDNPLDRVVAMQEYVSACPESVLGNSLLFASKLHMEAMIMMAGGNIDSAVNVRHHASP